MRTGYQLSETHIRYAMENTKSCIEAASWLRVSHHCFKHNARKYIDRESGLNLYDLHKRNCAVNRAKAQYVHKKAVFGRKSTTLETILKSTYTLHRKAQLIVRHGFLPECCDHCGYNKRREVDYTTPLMLWYKDHDPDNKDPENARLLCYNCYYLISYINNSKYVTG